MTPFQKVPNSKGFTHIFRVLSRFEVVRDHSFESARAKRRVSGLALRHIPVGGSRAFSAPTRGREREREKEKEKERERERNALLFEMGEFLRAGRWKNIRERKRDGARCEAKKRKNAESSRGVRRIRGRARYGRGSRVLLDLGRARATRE